MTYVQILDGIVKNTIMLSDTSLISLLSEGFDYLIQVDDLTPQPGPGWTYDGTNFSNNPVAMTLSQAIQYNISQFQSDLIQFIDSSYTVDQRLNFNALYNLAIQNGLTNRAAYIVQAFTWAQSVVSYASSYVSSVQAMTDVPTVNASMWNFGLIALPNPNITIMGALEITT